MCQAYLPKSYKEYMEKVRSSEGLTNSLAGKTLARMRGSGSEPKVTEPMPAPKATIVLPIAEKLKKDRQIANTAIITIIEKTVFIALKSSILNYSRSIDKDEALKLKINAAISIVEEFELKELATYDRQRILTSVVKRDVELDADDREYLLDKCYKSADKAVAILHAFVNSHVNNSGGIMSPDVAGSNGSSTNYKLPLYTSHEQSNYYTAVVAHVQTYFNQEMIRHQQSVYRDLFFAMNETFRDMNKQQNEFQRIGADIGLGSMKSFRYKWLDLIKKFEDIPKRTAELQQVSVIRAVEK